MLRSRSVAKNTLLIFSALGSVLLISLVVDSFKNTENRSPKEFEGHQERFYFEQHLVQMGKSPLAWDCHDGARDQVRYTRDSCFAEHIVEIDLAQTGVPGNMNLIANGDASFSSPLGIHQLSVEQTEALRATLLSGLTIIPSQVDNSHMPAYLSSIEACIDGKSFQAIRRIAMDIEFERLASQVASDAGFEITRTSPGHCM